MPKELSRQLLSNVSMSADITSTDMAIEGYPFYSMQFSWTGTPTGSVEIQASVDHVNWSTVAGSATNTGGTAGSVLIDYDGSAVRYVRAHYTFGSSTGSLSVVLFAKSGG